MTKQEQPIIVDRKTDRALSNDQLPPGISMALIKAFCSAHACNFHSMEVFVHEQGWQSDPLRFRVGTHDFPSRGVNVEWEAVRKWRLSMEKCDYDASLEIAAVLAVLSSKAELAGVAGTAKAIKEAVAVANREIAELETIRWIKLQEHVEAQGGEG